MLTLIRPILQLLPHPTTAWLPRTLEHSYIGWMDGMERMLMRMRSALGQLNWIKCNLVLQYGHVCREETVMWYFVVSVYRNVLHCSVISLL